jgi:hypothetical protein
MLSEGLAALLGHLLPYRDAGLKLEPLAVIAACAVLQALADEATALEASRISPVAMAPTALPENVVKLDPRADRRGGVA